VFFFPPPQKNCPKFRSTSRLKYIPCTPDCNRYPIHWNSFRLLHVYPPIRTRWLSLTPTIQFIYVRYIIMFMHTRVPPPHGFASDNSDGPFIYYFVLLVNIMYYVCLWFSLLLLFSCVCRSENDKYAVYLYNIKLVFELCDISIQRLKRSLRIFKMIKPSFADRW